MSGSATVLDLLRHGDTGASGFRGRTDDPLTLEGWRRMREATSEPRDWRAVITSPKTRCAAFARELASGIGVPLEVEPRLVELDFGDWEGMTAERILREQPGALERFWEDPASITPPGGEALSAFESRVLEASNDLAGRHAGRTVLVVTHGGVIRLLLARAAGRPARELLREHVPLASMHRVVVEALW